MTSPNDAQHAPDAAQLEFAGGVRSDYADVLSAEVIAALRALTPLDRERVRLMNERTQRRLLRAREKSSIRFLEPEAAVGRAGLTVADARAGRFVGGVVPRDLQRQWVQGTGPAARPRVPIEKSLRNVAYALLSGADGWMFDGEDALGQVDSMSLENQRSLKLAIARAPVFLRVAKDVAADMNTWAQGFFGHTIIADYEQQLSFTTKIFRARGLHLDDRHVRWSDGRGFSASIVDAACYVVNNQARLRADGASVVLYLPKIQTADEAALWGELLSALESHLSLPIGTIKAYVLIEQLEASFQLMEIRAALGQHFVGFNTGRWDYINSVSDACAWDATMVNPNIDAITMTYGYMRNYEDRVRRAVNTPDKNGQFALWQGGMEPNIPVGSDAGVAAGMKRAVAGAEREQRAGASGKWVAHWKMVHIIRPVWEAAGQANQLGRAFPPLSYDPRDADALTMLEPAPRTVRGARDLLSVALQYGNAFGQGMQAAALKPADFFGDDDVLYLMEDMATGEIRLSILWEWLHKAAPFSQADVDTGVQVGDTLSLDMFRRLLAEEYEKLLKAANKDVHEDSKNTSLPIARSIVEAYVLRAFKAPWYVDLLNLTIGNSDVPTAKERVDAYLVAYSEHGVRITHNLDFRSSDSSILSGAMLNSRAAP